MFCVEKIARKLLNSNKFFPLYKIFEMKLPTYNLGLDRWHGMAYTIFFHVKLQTVSTVTLLKASWYILNTCATLYPILHCAYIYIHIVEELHTPL